jgi:hypothetical protein
MSSRETLIIFPELNPGGWSAARPANATAPVVGSIAATLTTAGSLLATDPLVVTAPVDPDELLNSMRTLRLRLSQRRSRSPLSSVA